MDTPKVLGKEEALEIWFCLSLFLKQLYGQLYGNYMLKKL
jgi:hypothetical protein